MAQSRLTLRYAPVWFLAFALLFARDSWTSDEGDNRSGGPGSSNGAVLQSFGAGSIIVPVDGCYQRPDTMDSSEIQEVFGDTPASLACNGTGDIGVVEAFGLMTRLIEAGVPIHWSVKNFKANIHEPDFSITSAGSAPVDHYDPSTGSRTSPYGGLTTIDYMGGPFVIAAADTDGDGTGDAAEAQAALSSFGSSFGAVDLHIANIGFGAPVFRTVDQLPKMAVVDMNTASGGNITSNATSQVLAAPDGYMVLGKFTPAPSWWHVITVDDVRSGALINQDYTLVWVPEFSIQNSGANPYVQEFVSELALFADSGGNVLTFDDGIASIEGFGNTPGGSYSEKQPPTFSFHAEDGVLINGNGSGTWGSCNGSELTHTDDASEPTCQWGGQCWFGTGGDVHAWKDRTAPQVTSGSDQTSFFSGVEACAVTFHSDADKSDWVLAGYRRKDNDPDKGRIIYLGANNWRGQKPVGFRIMFNTIFAAPSALGRSKDEISRSSPTLAEAFGITPVFQGSIDAFFPPKTKTTFTGSGSADSFEFPHFTGHFRAIRQSAAADVSLDAFNDGNSGPDDCPDGSVDTSGDCIFDADLLLPPLASGECVTDPTNPGEPVTGMDGSCRAVFTNLSSGANPKLLTIDEDSIGGALDPLLDPSSSFSESELETLAKRIQAGDRDLTPGGSGSEGDVDGDGEPDDVDPDIDGDGINNDADTDDDNDGIPDLDDFVPRLGAIDRSTPALIGQSTLVGGTRPKMAYFGAHDGMLHAVCVDDVGPCAGNAGKELWAFMPRTQLGLVAANDQRIDGTPKVSDVFGDFGTFSGGSFVSATPDGLNEFRTVLIFQTGTNRPGNPEALYALDISDPAEPRVLWETALAGAGLTVALGTAQTSAGERFLAFVQTNKNGGNGFQVRAIDVIDGSDAWPSPFDYDYATTRGGSSTLPPDTGVPGGVSLVDTTGLQVVDQVLVPSLYGELWVLNAEDGTSKFEDTGGNRIPLFRFEDDFHPVGAVPTVFSDGAGQFYAVFGSGGYADYQTDVKQWSPGDVDQFGVSVNLDVARTVPFDDSDSSPGGDVVLRNLGAGERVFAQATVIGDSVLFITDSEDINAASYGSPTNTGTVYGFDNFGTGSEAAQSPIVVWGGASSVEAQAGTGKGYVGASKGLKEVSADFANGTAVELGNQPKSVRRLWLKLK